VRKLGHAAGLAVGDVYRGVSARVAPVTPALAAGIHTIDDDLLGQDGTMRQGRASRREEDADLLVRFLRPLLALLMLLRECVTLCFGTAMRIGGMSSSRDDSPGRKVYHGAGAATGVGVGVEVQSASEISALAAGVEVEGEGVGVKVRTGEACEALVDGSQRMDQEGRSSRGRLKGRERVGRAKAREAMLRNEGVVQYRCGPWSGWR
jgi:hypothetical protein